MGDQPHHHILPFSDLEELSSWSLLFLTLYLRKEYDYILPYSSPRGSHARRIELHHQIWTSMSLRSIARPSCFQSLGLY